jgi:hypothetical protein
MTPAHAATCNQTTTIEKKKFCLHASVTLTAALPTPFINNFSVFEMALETKLSALLSILLFMVFAEEESSPRVVVLEGFGGMCRAKVTCWSVPCFQNFNFGLHNFSLQQRGVRLKFHPAARAAPRFFFAKVYPSRKKEKEEK